MNFSIFFVSPLTSGLITLIFLSWLRLRPSFPITLVAVMAASESCAQALHINTFLHGDEQKNIEQLAQRLSELPADAKIITQPFADSFTKKTYSLEIVTITPFLLDRLVGRNIIPKEEDLFPSTLAEIHFLLRRELFLGWLFSGQVQTIGPCPNFFPSPYGDLHSGIFDFLFYLRQRICEHAGQIIYTISPCDLAKEFNITHVLVATKMDPKYLEHIKSIAEDSWTSSDGSFLLANMAQDQLMRRACESQ